LQWGDEGKGKLVDYYADRFDATVRFNGGSNAGHTIVTGGKTYVFHLLPSGALHSRRSLIGPGVALDPVVLKEELDFLGKEGIKADLLIDGRTSLVTPLEKELDAHLEGARGTKAIGTTKRGIGPTYAVRALRIGPRVMDLVSGSFDQGSMRAFYRLFFKDVPDLGEWMMVTRSLLEGRVGDVGAAVTGLNNAGKSVIFEGAQGTLLDLLHGTYTYVTGAHTLANYVPASLGIPAKAVGRVLGVAKAYTTRVGGGPFPTEAESSVGENIREAGREYGATTGRPRRIGWLDLVGLRYAVRINGVDEIALTKLDILTKSRELKVCVAYTIEGSEVTDMAAALPRIAEAKPVLKDLPSLFGLELRGPRLPRPAESFIELIESELKTKVGLVSTGEERTAIQKT
jgi:adenylosuccinate synthase